MGYSVGTIGQRGRFYVETDDEEFVVTLLKPGEVYRWSADQPSGDYVIPAEETGPAS